MHRSVVALLFLAVTTASDLPYLLSQFVDAYRMYVDRDGGLFFFNYDFGDGTPPVTGVNQVLLIINWKPEKYETFVSDEAVSFSIQFNKAFIIIGNKNKRHFMTFYNCDMDIMYATDALASENNRPIVLQSLNFGNCIITWDNGTRVPIHAHNEMYLSMVSQAMIEKMPKYLKTAHPFSKKITFAGLQTMFSDGVIEKMESSSNPYLLRRFTEAFNDYLMNRVESSRYLSFEYNFGHGTPPINGEATVYVFYGLKLIDTLKKGYLSLNFRIDGPAFMIQRNQTFMKFAHCDFVVTYKNSPIVVDYLKVHNCTDINFDDDPVQSERETYLNLLSLALYDQVAKYFVVKNLKNLTSVDLQEMFSDAMYEALMMTNSSIARNHL